MDRATPISPPTAGCGPAPTVAPRGDARAAQPIRAARGFQTGESGRRRGRTGNRHRDRDPTQPNPTQPGGPTASRNRDRDQRREHSRAMQRAKTPAVSAGRSWGSVWVFRWGQPWGGSPRGRRVRCGPQRSRYLCVCPWVCVCVRVWWGEPPVLPPVIPRSPPGAEAAPAHPAAAAAAAVERRPDQPDPPAPPAAAQGQCAGDTERLTERVYRNRECWGSRWCWRNGRISCFREVGRLRKTRCRGSPDTPFLLKCPVGP